MGLMQSFAGRSATGFVKSDQNTKLVALAGNPNVGKSSIFNTLTGLHQHTGNWTGKTVGCAVGVYKCKHKHKRKSNRKARESCNQQPPILLADLPGCYSLKPHSVEENESLNFLRTQPIDAVVVVCDALNLERNLLLAYQIRYIFRESSIPLIVCINLIDEARKQGVEISPEKLSEMTGFTVVMTSAKSGIGLDCLRAEIERAAYRKSTPNIPHRETLEQPRGVTNTTDVKNLPSAANFLSVTRQAVAEAMCSPASAQATNAKRQRLSPADHVCMGRYTAIPVALIFLSLVFWLTIVGANYPSAWLSTVFGHVGDWLATETVWSWCPWWVKGFLLDGIYRTLTWVIAVMLPPMAIFFPLYTLLEDIGFLPRIAFNFDRCFHSCNACGKQSLTMCMGFGCNAAGVTACRIIDSPRERMIAVLTNSLVPCNGKFPTILAMVTILLAGTSVGQGVWAQAIASLAVTACILLSVGITFFVSKILSITVLKGQPGGFILELPPYRVPNVGQVLVRSMLDRTLFVLGRAAAVSAPAGGILWICGQIQVGEINLLVYLSQLIHPVGVWLGVNGAALIALVLAAPANELVLPILWMIYTAGGTLLDYGSIHTLNTQLNVNGWTWQTVVCFLILFIFHAPCTTTLLTVKKETGSWQWCSLAAVIPILVGITLCTVIRFVFSFI